MTFIRGIQTYKTYTNKVQNSNYHGLSRRQSRETIMELYEESIMPDESILETTPSSLMHTVYNTVLGTKIFWDVRPYSKCLNHRSQ